jgi:hypothetical protein
LIIIALWVYLSPDGSGFGDVQYDHIRVGMTQQEVEDLLGSPPGDYSPSDYAPWDLGEPHYTSTDGNVGIWMNDRILIEVIFDADGRVVRKQAFTMYRHEDESFRMPRFIRKLLQKVGL